jgi:predicted O-methyltransferase YrrM
MAQFKLQLPLALMQKQNKGKWPIHWVSIKGLEQPIQNLGTDIVGYEIGTAYGWSLVYLLNNTTNIKHIYAVDPLMPYSYIDPSDGTTAVVTQEDQDAIKNMWSDNTSAHADKITLITQTASDAALNIADESLDFVFIDGDHSYEAVKQDIKSYYSKVRSGGLFAGHDYKWEKDNVGRAVDEFLHEYGIDKSKLVLCENDAWYIIKP